MDLAYLLFDLVFGNVRGNLLDDVLRFLGNLLIGKENCKNLESKGCLLIKWMKIF